MSVTFVALGTYVLNNYVLLVLYYRQWCIKFCRLLSLLYLL